MQPHFPPPAAPRLPPRAPQTTHVLLPQRPQPTPVPVSSITPTPPHGYPWLRSVVPLSSTRAGVCQWWSSLSSGPKAVPGPQSVLINVQTTAHSEHEEPKSLQLPGRPAPAGHWPRQTHTEVVPVSRRVELRRSRGELFPTPEGSTHYPANPQRSPFHRAAQLCLGSAISAFGTSLEAKLGSGTAQSGGVSSAHTAG